MLSDVPNPSRGSWWHRWALAAPVVFLCGVLWNESAESQAGGKADGANDASGAVGVLAAGGTPVVVDDVRPEDTVLLPVQAAPGMRARYVKRLQKAVSGAQKRAGSAAAQALPKEHRLTEGAEPCASDPKCLLSTGQKLGAKRIVGTTLAAVGDDFKVTMTIVDVESARLVSQAPHKVGHNALARVGGGIFENTMKAARAPLSPAPKGEPKITDEGFSVIAVQGARGKATSLKSGQPAGLVAENPGVPAGELGMLEGATIAKAEGDEAGEKAGPEMVKVSGADMAARMEESEGGDDGKAGDGKSSGSLEDVVADGLEELREGKKKGGKQKRKAKGATPPNPAEAAARAAQRIQIMIMVVAAMFSFSVAFAASYQLSGSKKKEEVSYKAPVSVKEAAKTTAILRACARQLTPGILMSAELEKSKRFCFALLDGQEVSVDVLQVAPEDRPAFRPGMQLCGQFVHEGGTAMCMFTVKRQRKISPTRLRVLFSAPERLARVTVPKGFQIPVGRRTPLIVKVKREGPPKEVWQTRAVFASEDSLRLALDSDVFEMESGNQVEVTVRWDNDRADLCGEVVGLDDETVTLEIGDKNGGGAPREYKTVLQRLESQWLAQLGK